MSEGAINRRRFMTLSAGVVSLPAAGFVATAGRARVEAQADSAVMQPRLAQPIQTPDVVEFQIREYLRMRIPKLEVPATAAEWTAESARLRKLVLHDVLFHGWPKEWLTAPAPFEDLGFVPSGPGYRIRKLRFEIVPGFTSVALLYEPEKVTRKLPATLNLNGHSPHGKAAEYKQKRCINNAKRGILALSPEWPECGELGVPENNHWFGAHLNLVGANATGFFFLSMSRPLDYLWDHPNVDRQRIGVTGLSGGAWQTIVLSALDERVHAAIPVSGYFPMVGGVARRGDIGDLEYNPPDLRMHVDYTTLTAMRAPKPTLLIYATEDPYCCLSPVEKLELYDPVVPFYKLYGKEAAFAFHENTDPGTHNYQLDNRQQSYAFFNTHFGLKGDAKEIPVDHELKSCEELVVGIPADNLTILGLARKIAAGRRRDAIPAEGPARTAWAQKARENLAKIVRYASVTVKHPWAMAATKRIGVATISYRLQMSNDLSATAISVRTATTLPAAPVMCVLNDAGFQAVKQEVYTVPSTAPVSANCRANPVAFQANRGQDVWAVNLLFTGDASPDALGEAKAEFANSALYTQLIASIGDRPLGLQVAQLIAVLKWAKARGGSTAPCRIDSTGIRSQITTLVAVALEPGLVGDVVIREGMPSFQHLLDKAVTYQDAPDLFCLDLYRDFDVDPLVALAGETKITQKFLGAGGTC